MIYLSASVITHNGEVCGRVRVCACVCVRVSVFVCVCVCVRMCRTDAARSALSEEMVICSFCLNNCVIIRWIFGGKVD